MQVRTIALAASLSLSLFAVGCNNKAKEASRAAAAKSAEEAEIDQRSKVVAQGLIQQAADDAEKKRAAAAQQKAEARKKLQQAAIDNPGSVLDSNKLQMVDDGKRHLTSISLTNKSEFSMTDIRGTVDFHGGADYHGDNGDIMAQVPVQLTGAIAPGASMVFSEQQHTLSGAAIQLPKAPAQVTFTVTGAKVGSEGIDSTAVPMAADGGAVANSGTQ
jgi:hypothetical protein